MIFLVIPTYNEKGNIADLIRQVLDLKVVDRILVVDDNSPDGTGDVAEKMGAENSAVLLLRRFKRYGRGSAGLDGFRFALERGATHVIEMDADFSHDPRHLPQLVEGSRHFDVVLGSRYIKGGRDERGWERRLMTALARLYVRTVLNIPIHDVSSGYRLFSRKVLEAVDLNDMVSTGPSIVLEILYKVILKGFRVGETPIVFPERRQGKSKLDYITLLETMVMVLRLKKMAKQGRIF